MYSRTKCCGRCMRAETSYFQCRAYLYMSRNLIGTDTSGLSDPFARIVIRNRVMRTRTATTTLNPIWDQTCVLESLQFYMSPEMLKAKAAPIVVEIFDFDDMLELNFIGRTLVHPYIITFADKGYMPPKLDWWTIYRNQKRAGELFAAVELIEVPSCLLLYLQSSPTTYSYCSLLLYECFSCMIRVYGVIICMRVAAGRDGGVGRIVRRGRRRGEVHGKNPGPGEPVHDPALLR